MFQSIPCPQSAKSVAHINAIIYCLKGGFCDNIYFVFGRFYVNISSNLKFLTTAWCREWVTAFEQFFVIFQKLSQIPI